MNRQQLPQTDSIQDLAKFWDTHDLTDFENQLEVVSEPVFERNTDIVVRLESNEASALRALAGASGVGDSELVRQWVLDRIHAT